MSSAHTSDISDGIPLHGVVGAQELFERDLAFFSTQGEHELGRLLALADQVIEEGKDPYPHPDTLQALVDIAQARHLAVPESVEAHLATLIPDRTTDYGW